MSAEHTTHPTAGKATATAITELLVAGMNCSNCARHVTEAIQSVPGVRSVSVTLDAGRATVRWVGDEPCDVAAVLSAVKAAGYKAKPVEAADHDHGGKHQAGWRSNLWLGAVVTSLLLAGEWAFHLGTARWFQWLSFALAGMVQIFAGAQFYRGAWRQLKVGSSNMDTLVALGSTTAFGYSTWTLFSGLGGHVYFMEAAAIITLISVGHWLEARVSERASGALKSLLHLAPQTARRLDTGRADLQVGQDTQQRVPATSELEVPVSELKIGDLVGLRPGDRVPTDGVVVEGDSAVDEAMLTGESAPVDKTAGSEVYAGTVTMNGRLVMRVTATGEATALAHIIAAVQRAQTSRADIQRLADRVSNVFVPAVVLVALAAGLWWGLTPESAMATHVWLGQWLWHVHVPTGAAAAFIISAAVLIIACPCAMGLATPAAIMAAANAAARRGILIRDGVALEKAGKITAIVFDKTGTLTEGKPSVVKIWNPARPVPPHPDPLPQREGTAKVAPELSEDARFADNLTTILPPHEPRSSGRQSAPSEMGKKSEPTDVGCYGSGVQSANFALGKSLPAGEGWGEGDATAEVVQVAAALARHSTHPISRAIAKISTEEIQVADWKEIRGAGVEGNIQHPTPKAFGATSNIQRPLKLARLGSLRWLRENGVDLNAGESFIAEWSGQGSTIVGLATENQLAALFAVTDTVKPGAAKVVEQLHRRGLKSFLLTGDNALTAAGIAKQSGIAPENVFAEARPEQKAGFVKKLQARGERVAFVGDGINDAPALTQADLGIAVGRASDVAREAADIILLKSEIEAVPEALGLARATLRTIKQNLFWAFFYNAVGVPLAALGFMSPVLCAAAMGFSDLIVIGNALRLARRRAV